MNLLPRIVAIASRAAFLASLVGLGTAAAQTENGFDFGGTQRTRYETLDPQFRAGFSNSDQAVALQTTLAFNWRHDAWLVGGEIMDSRGYGNDTGSFANGTTANSLEPLQAYVAWRHDASTFRVGRVTQDLGKRRLVARNRYRNTVNNFTGVDWSWTGAEGRAARAFYWIPMRALPSDQASVLDNEYELDKGSRGSSIAGFFYQFPAFANQHRLESYVFDAEAEPPGDPARSTVTLGARAICAPAGQWNYEVEAGFRTANRAASGASRAATRHQASLCTSRSATVRRVGRRTSCSSTTARRATRIRPTRRSTFQHAVRRAASLRPTGIYGIVARSNIDSPGVRLTFRPGRVASDAVLSTLRLESARRLDRLGWRDATGAAGDSIGPPRGQFTWTAIPDRLSFETGFATMGGALRRANRRRRVSRRPAVLLRRADDDVLAIGGAAVPSRSFVALLPSLALIAGAASADEGMWTFDNFPSELVRERFGVTIDDAWLERVRLATVRLSGCTGSFVSTNGLTLTNHHCVSGCLAQSSTRERSLIDLGFVAGSREAELDCATQIADVLEKLENVTAKVQDATRGLPARDANERRRQTLTQLEQACESASQRAGKPLKCEAVTLYNGGQYWLYQYRRYDDVRLVFAPEDDIAAFGGDPDNFQYPRWCVDFSLLRAYENGSPAATPQHLTIDFDGPAAGEPVFVPGHPGSTDRELTVAELRALRDRSFPPALLRASELRGRYLQFAKTGEDARRIVQDSLFGLENSLKVQRKQLDALLDDALLAEKRDADEDLRARVNRNRELAAEIGDPWQKIEGALAVEATRFLPYQYVEGGTGFNSRLYRYARTLVRAAAERPKPNAERLREYTDGFLPRLEQQLAAPVPIYPELDQLTLSFSLERMREWLGPDAPVVRRLLATESPEALAARLVDGSKLADPAVRMRLWNGGQAAIDASTDRSSCSRLLAPRAQPRKWRTSRGTSRPRTSDARRFQIFGDHLRRDALGRTAGVQG